MAVQVAIDPKLVLDSQGGDVVDASTGETVPVQVMIEAYREHKVLIRTLADLRAGVWSLTKKDYEDLTAPFITAWSVFNNLMSEHEKQRT